MSRYTVCLATVKDEASKTGDLRRFLMDYQLWSQVTAEFEPIIRIGFRGGKAAFYSPDNEEMFNKVLDAGGEGILAITSAPYQELCRLHGQVFLFGEKVIRIQYLPDQERKCRAYARRFLRLVPGNVDSGFESASDTDFPNEGHVLLLRPSIARLPRDKAEQLAKWMMKVGRQGSFLLPPVFEEAADDSYYADSETLSRLEVRQDLARNNGIEVYQPEEPAGFTMWRLSDHPALRDILVEGGTLTIPRSSDAVRTTLHLTVCDEPSTRDADPLLAYRNVFLFDPDSLPGPDWGASFARAAFADLEQSVPMALDGMPWVKVTLQNQAPVSWRVSTAGGGTNRGQAEGNWSNLNEMGRLLTRKEWRDFFNEEVLWPSRNNDHDLAERRFIENFWRCPWSSETRPGPWRLVMGGDFILPGHELQGGLRPVPKRHAAWPDRPPPRLTKRPDGWVLEHTAANEDKILQWRLLMPLGTLICRHQVFRIGIGRLNQGYVLST